MVSGQVLFIALHLLGLACFTFIVIKRLQPLLQARSDPRFDRPLARLRLVLQFWLAQWRHPRYRFAGALHLLIFAGFLILISRAFSLLAMGVSDRFAVAENSGFFDAMRAYAATVVFVCMIVAAIRRIVVKPARYPRSADAIFLLGLIAILMLADGILEGSRAALHAQQATGAESLAALSLPWVICHALSTADRWWLRQTYLGSYMLHEVTFFFLLCYRPFGIQFHVETSLFAIFFGKLDRGTVKPVLWGLPDEKLDTVQSIGVKKFDDFTWKHILDFYTCADCGRCADQCPAHAVGRPLAPRAFSSKARDYAFRRYPVWGASRDGQPLVGGLFSEDEIWSCTTCGACEAECPLLIEYIDKIVDLRRGLVDDGKAPRSLHKPLKALESRGNPFGKLEKKRADWAQGAVRSANGEGVQTLYFVDSITSYDDRIQSIGRSTARILAQTGEDFAILGPKERDSGHDVRRFGEETLFMALREHNTAAIRASQARRIVTADTTRHHEGSCSYRNENFFW